ncbi:MAG: transcription elongation factor GreA [Candidatus Pacebacteria bacterium]|nr:transcription elongation factor GreA [Candidatus Paceibacterota bacterium]
MDYLSQKKYNELKKELEELLSNGRRELAQQLDEAKSLGDLKENAEYHQARDDQAKLESRVLKLEELLKNATIIKKSKTDEVQVGVTVEIAKKLASKTATYEIVGTEDADIFKGKIDLNAPLAKAMMGKKKGDIFDFKLPNDEVVSYRIINIK